MSKKGATSSRFEAAKFGAEEHNRREKDLDYIRTDLSHLNRTWEAPDFVSVKDAHNKVADKYYEHHVTKKGTNKHLPSNATPIQETVLVINENTTMDELKDFARMVQETWGYRPLAIYTHLDEGHKNAWNRGQWIANRHAHLIFDSTDSNGDSLKPLSESRRESIKNQFEKKEKKKAEADPSYVPRQWVEPAEWAKIKPFDYMQDLAAKALHMERGEKSGKKALKAREFKVEQLAKDIEKLEAIVSDLHDGIANLTTATKELEEQKATLENEVSALVQKVETMKAEQASIEEVEKSITALKAKMAAFSVAASAVSMAASALDAGKSAFEATKGLFGQSSKDKRIEELTAENKQLQESSDAAIAEAAKKATSDAATIKNLQNSITYKDGQIKTAEDKASRWRALVDGLWPSAQSAIRILASHLTLHMGLRLPIRDVETIDGVLDTGKAIAPTRKERGNFLIEMLRAIYPEKDRQNSIDVLADEVQKVADYSHQHLDRGIEQGRWSGLGR